MTIGLYIAFLALVVIVSIAIACGMKKLGVAEKKPPFLALLKSICWFRVAIICVAVMILSTWGIYYIWSLTNKMGIGIPFQEEIPICTSPTPFIGLFSIDADKGVYIESEDVTITVSELHPDTSYTRYNLLNATLDYSIRGNGNITVVLPLASKSENSISIAEPANNESNNSAEIVSEEDYDLRYCKDYNILPSEKEKLIAISDGWGKTNTDKALDYNFAKWIKSTCKYEDSFGGSAIVKSIAVNGETTVSFELRGISFVQFEGLLSGVHFIASADNIQNRTIKVITPRDYVFNNGTAPVNKKIDNDSIIWDFSAKTEISLEVRKVFLYQ